MNMDELDIVAMPFRNKLLKGSETIDKVAESRQ